MPRRLTQLTIGLTLYGASAAMILLAGLGADPWDVFHQGLSRRTGLGVGWWVCIVGALVLLLWIPLRQRPGIGTVANVIVIGVVMEVVLALAEPADGAVARAALLAAGIVLNGVATGLYIGARLGPGPRDGLMTGLAARGHSIRVVRTGIELTVLVLGALLGGTVGIGTLAYALAIGPLAHVLIPLLTVPPPAASEEPAVRGEALAGDPARPVPGEERDDVGHLLRPAQASQRRPGDQRVGLLGRQDHPVRVGQARHDAVDADPARPELLGEGRAPEVDRGLRRAVEGPAGTGGDGRAGGDDDDAPAVGQLPRALLEQHERRPGDRAEDALELVGPHVVDRPEAGDSGIRDEDVGRPVGRPGLGEQAAHVVRVGDVGADGGGAGARLLERSDGGARGGLVAAEVHGDGGAGSGEGEGRGAADAARAAGDDGVVHRPIVVAPLITRKDGSAAL